MLTPKPYEIYKHFKGNCYQIICMAQDSEDGEQVVVYQGLYAPYKIYSRKLTMFMEEVDKNKYPDANQKYRFELLDSEGFAVDRDRINIKPDSATEPEPEQTPELETKTEVKDNSAVEDDRLSLEKKADIQKRRQQAAMINPILAKFLDATSDDEQLEIIVNYREEITEDILLPMELSLGLEPGEGRLADRIFAIRNCLELKKRYERSNRNY